VLPPNGAVPTSTWTNEARTWIGSRRWQMVWCIFRSIRSSSSTADKLDLYHSSTNVHHSVSDRPTIRQSVRPSVSRSSLTWHVISYKLKRTWLELVWCTSRSDTGLERSYIRNYWEYSSRRPLQSAFHRQYNRKHMFVWCVWPPTL